MRKNIPYIIKKKKNKQKITMLTSYDAAFSRLVDKSDIDMILVGDSLGMVIQGKENTLQVSIDDIIYHTKIVVNNTQNTFIVADMPFMSYQVSPEKALENAGRIIKETNAQAVKLEGGYNIIDTIKKINTASIPVMGHLGLLPQSINKLGSYKIQGKTSSSASKMIKEAKALQDAGVFAIVLEAIPENLAKEITDSLSIPTIGIGAGVYTDGQVLVVNDMLGMNEEFNPYFVKKYANLENIITKAIIEYKTEVENSTFPNREYSFRKKNKKESKLYSN